MQATVSWRHLAVVSARQERDQGRAASEAGAKVTAVITQGEWLNRLGIGARAAALATANPERIPELEQAVDRLCHEEQMGQLFKVMGVYSPDWPAPAGLEA